MSAVGRTCVGGTWRTLGLTVIEETVDVRPVEGTVKSGVCSEVTFDDFERGTRSLTGQCSSDSLSSLSMSTVSQKNPVISAAALFLEDEIDDVT